jgi:hypothetical protein
MSLLKNVLQRVLPTPILYVRFKKNELEIKHIQSGKTISRKSTITFSNDRLLIADFEPAEAFMRTVTRELLNSKNKTFTPSLKIVFQPVDSVINAVTPSERRIYVDSAYFAGARYVWIIEHQNLLSDEDVLAITKNKPVY